MQIKWLNNKIFSTCILKIYKSILKEVEERFNLEIGYDITLSYMWCLHGKIKIILHIENSSGVMGVGSLGSVQYSYDNFLNFFMWSQALLTSSS